MYFEKNVMEIFWKEKSRNIFKRDKTVFFQNNEGWRNKQPIIFYYFFFL